MFSSNLCYLHMARDSHWTLQKTLGEGLYEVKRENRGRVGS
jgi:hypothetical protein